MTTVPPRPAAPETCGEWFHPAPTQRCALAAGHFGLHEPPAAPDATAGDGLREALAGMLTTWVIGVAYENAWLCADALLPTVRRVAEQRAAEELLAAADSYEDEAEQPAINRLADEVYRPGDCLSSLWLRARAAALTAADHGRNAT